MGEKGKHECPQDYKPIRDENTCQQASIDLELNYDRDQNVVGTRDSVCYLCTGCNPDITKVDNTYGGGAIWICQKSRCFKSFHVF